MSTFASLVEAVQGSTEVWVMVRLPRTSLGPRPGYPGYELWDPDEWDSRSGAREAMKRVFEVLRSLPGWKAKGKPEEMGNPALWRVKLRGPTDEISQVLNSPARIADRELSYKTVELGTLQTYAKGRRR